MIFFKQLLYILRGLGRAPGYALAFVLTLGLGIGANTAIFSVVNGVLLRPLPYPDADRIMYLRHNAEQFGIDNMGFSFVEIADFREQSQTIDEFVEFGDWTFNVLDRGEPHRATGGLVTPNYFTVMGLQPALGRVLSAADQGDVEPVVVLTHEYWMRVLGGDPEVLGETLNLTVKQARIVGVLRPGSHYAALQRKQDFYVNYASNDHYMGAAMQDERRHRMTDVFARLAPQASVEAARLEMDAVHSRLRQQYPDDYPERFGLSLQLKPWREELTEQARPTLLILLATAACVLLISCANVANLTLTRLVRRERELAIRTALGATAARLRRQLLGENLVLAIGGALLGLTIAAVGLDLLVAYAARHTPRTGEIAIDSGVLLLTLATAFGAALFFAWAPGFSLGKDPSEALSSAGGGRSTGGLSRRRAQRLLVVAQLALSFVLLVGAGLLVRSLINLYGVDPGFDLDNVLTLQAPDFQQQSPEQRAQFSSEVLQQIQRHGQIESAALASTIPLEPRYTAVQREYRVEGQQVEPQAGAPRSHFKTISGDYFETVGQPLLLGRSFDENRDHADAPPAAMLNKAMADFYFADQDPIGRRLSWKLGNGQWSPWRSIVGVVADSREAGLDRAVDHTLYLPVSQGFNPSTVLVRASTESAELTPYVVETIRNLDPDRPIDHIQTLEELRAESIAPQRLNTTLFVAFAALALVIAAVGVAGVLAFSVSRRTQEIGIRVALGADSNTVLSMVLREGTSMALAGLLLGAVGALVAGRLLSTLLFEIQPLDPMTFAMMAVVMLLVAVGACLLPARRALQVDPMVALRSE